MCWLCNFLSLAFCRRAWIQHYRTGQTRIADCKDGFLPRALPPREVPFCSLDAGIDAGQMSTFVNLADRKAKPNHFKSWCMVFFAFGFGSSFGQSWMQHALAQLEQVPFEATCEP